MSELTLPPPPDDGGRNFENWNQETANAGAHYARYVNDKQSESSLAIVHKYERELRSRLVGGVVMQATVIAMGACAYLSQTADMSAFAEAGFVAILALPALWAVRQLSKYGPLIQSAKNDANELRQQADTAHIASRQLDPIPRSKN